MPPAGSACDPALSSDGLLRRACALIAHFEADQLVIQNYLTGTESYVHHQILPVLASLTDPVPEDEVLNILGGAPAASLLDQLLERDLVLRCGTPKEERDRAVAASWPWGQEARWFHYRTRRTGFTYDFEAERENLLAHALQTPAPPPYKDLGPPHLWLPSPQPLSASLGDTLQRRRTLRDFGRHPVGLRQLATILHTTWGVTNQRTDPGIGPVILKTSPSGGARHPTEVYLVALNVEDLPGGVYHYCCGRHSLTPTGHNGSPEELTTAVLKVVTQQPWAADAAAVFIMTSVTGRSAWKYQQAHAYRVLLLDMGHLAQTFHLVCTALGLAPWTTAALDEEAAEDLLELDDPSELVLYAAACGHLPSPAERRA